jgi:hypothetical protein
MEPCSGAAGARARARKGFRFHADEEEDSDKESDQGLLWCAADCLGVIYRVVSDARCTDRYEQLALNWALAALGADLRAIS